MVWLIVGLAGLVVLGALVLVATRNARLHQPPDDTLVTDLLGPAEAPAVPARWQSPAWPTAHARQETPAWPPALSRSSTPTRPAPRAEEATAPLAAEPAAEREPAEPAAPPPPRAGEDAAAAPAARAPEEGGPPPAPADGEHWLETQLAWITSWSQRMHDQITSADQSEPGPGE